MVVVFTITEENYLIVSQFCDLGGPFCVYIYGIRLFGCAICLVSGVATKASMPSSTSFTIISSCFQTNIVL